MLAFGVSILIFLMIHLTPGDPAVAMLGGTAASRAEIDALHRELGFDLPLPVQYLRWMGGVLTGNLGYSYAQSTPVIDLIKQNFPYTFQLALASLAFSTIAGSGLGVLAAIKRNTAVDSLVMALAQLGTGLPSFWLGLLLISFFSVRLGWFPVFGGSSWNGLVLPALALGLGGAGFTARFARSSVVDVMHQQYVITARAKGLTRLRVLLKHVFRNALLPLLTIIGLQFGNLLSGAVVVETVFSRPGIGRLLVTSVLAKDYLTVQGIVLMMAILYALVNLFVDILYPLIDPRIAYQ